MPYRPTPKTEAKKAAMRARILDAARDLFARQGYDATTLQQIIREAQTSIGNCYFYFADKEAILLTIAEELRQEIAEKIDQAIAPYPLGAGLLAVAVYTGAKAVIENAAVARFALSDTAHPSLRPITAALFADRVERAFQAMPELFAGQPDATSKLAASAWHGAANVVLEGVINGRIMESPERVALFLVRWNLQALGLTDAVIHQAMTTLDNHRAKAH